MDDYSIEKSVVMANPLIQSLSCEKGHYIKSMNSGKRIKIVCSFCNKTIYDGTTDPFREVNIKIIEESAKHKNRIYPFVYLSLCKNTIQDEIDFFERNYFNQYYGYKIHPSISMQQLDAGDILNTNLPIIIHTKNDNYSNPKKIFEFAKNHKGNVILAHLCDIDIDILSSLMNYDNIWVDMSPFLSVCERIRESTHNLYAPKTFTTMDNIGILNELLNIIGEEKIIFGTDAPWGNVEEEVVFAKKILAEDRRYNKVFYENFLKIVGIIS